MSVRIARKSSPTGLRSVSSVLGLAVTIVALGACEEDDDDVEFVARPAQPTGTGGAAASSTPPRAGSGGSAGADAGSTAALDAGVQREAFRPVERAPTAQLLAGLSLPAGFQLQTFADELGHARMLAVRGSDIYLTRPMQADVLLLRDVDGDGSADERSVAASGLTGVHGIAFRGADYYLATPTSVYR